MRPLPSDELLPDANGQLTHGVTIAAPPEAIWPWLVQMGCRRAGYYSVDTLDNAGARSAREIHPELLHIAVGDILPATDRLGRPSYGDLRSGAWTGRETRFQRGAPSNRGRGRP